MRVYTKKIRNKYQIEMKIITVHELNEFVQNENKNDNGLRLFKKNFIVFFW